MNKYFKPIQPPPSPDPAVSPEPLTGFMCGTGRRSVGKAREQGHVLHQDLRAERNAALGGSCCAFSCKSDQHTASLSCH